MLNRAGISFIKVDAGQQPELAAKYDVMQAPTLVVVEGEATTHFCGTSEIRKFVDQEIQAREAFEPQEAFTL
jgi:ribonucleoside-triphosphate reductase